jgi:hypothetical protein
MVDDIVTILYSGAWFAGSVVPGLLNKKSSNDLREKQLG